MRILGRTFITVTAIFLLTIPESARAEFKPGSLPAGLKSKMVQGVPVVYADQGEGPPLVILSPYPMGIELWTDLAGRLAKSMRVIVIEPPGVRDPSSMGRDFSSEHLLHLYRNFVKSLGLRKIHILGLGESGGLAVAFGHHFPQNSGAVISINGFEAANWSEEFEATMAIYKQSAMGGAGMLLSMGSLRYSKKAPSPKEVASLSVPLRGGAAKNAVGARFEAFITDVKTGYILMMLPNHNRPTLLIRSKDDAILTEDYIPRTRSQIRKAPLHVGNLSDAGHFAFVDQPEKVAKMISGFLTKYPLTK